MKPDFAKRNWINKLLHNRVINVRWHRGGWKGKIKTTYSKCTYNVSHLHCFLHGEEIQIHIICMRHYTAATGRSKKDIGSNDTPGFLLHI
jgi:hypothetical protein